MSLTGLAIAVINPRGRVKYSATAGKVPGDVEPCETVAFVEPLGHDVMTIRWTVINTVDTAPQRTCPTPANDVMEILEHLTAVITHAIDVLSLQAAIEHRDELATAKGMLMERNNINADTAFALLARYSQNTNIKVAVISQRVIAAQ